MDQDRWKTVNHIFHAALEVSSSERHEFVLSASNGDLELQSEVELLLKADQEAGSYLESPLLAEDLFSNSNPPLNPGDILCGRFRILRSVGEGGMGHVFEAYDSELAVHLALKVIRPEIASNPEALTRFRQEVRLARRITHPNVCRTFDLERDTRAVDATTDVKQELVFLTMEFLEGETLDSRIKRTGSLPLHEALHVARQIADALTAAHAIGIVHRDMKPANIMLVPAESSGSYAFRAVITDFGLARLDSVFSQGNHSALSYSGHPIGTIAYMAPEQLDGSAVSAATDNYAFGLILFEMVTGKRAFPSDNFLSGIAKRLSGPPPSPEAKVPNLPAPWCRAIEGCLRVRPAERFQAATNIVAVLEGRRTNLPSVIKPTLLERLSLAAWPSRIRLLAFCGVLCAAVALFFGGYRLYQSRADSKVNPGALVYLTPVRNLTGEPSLDNLAELLKSSLDQSTQINLLDQSLVGDTLQLMKRSPDSAIDQPIAREIAMRTGAARVIFVTVTGSSGDFQINIDIQQPDNTPDRIRERWKQSIAWKVSASTTPSSTISPELLIAVRKTGDWIRLKAGESRNDIARLDTPPDDVTTGNWQALAEYTQAKRLQRENQPENAVDLLKHAIQLDPQFALAYSSLGDALLSLHRDLEGYRAYDIGLEMGLKNRLTRKEEDRIRGMRAVDTTDYELAVDAFHDLAVNYPNDPTGWIYPTFPLRMLRRDAEAIANLRRAIVLEPDAAYAPFALAQEHMIEGQFEDALQWIEYLKKHNHADSAAEDEAVLFLLKDRYKEAAEAFRTMASSPNSIRRSYSYQNLAGLEADMGSPRDAIDTLNLGIVEDDAQHNPDQRAAKLLARAYLQISLDRIDLSIEDVHAGFALSPTPEHALTADTVLGRAFAASGPKFAEQIRKELRFIQQALPNASYGKLAILVKLRTQGELEIASGSPRAALEILEDASAKDAPVGSRDYLARAFDAVASIENDPKAKANLISKELISYEPVALHPALVWTDMTSFPPGFYSDQLGRYLQTASRLQVHSKEIELATSAYIKLHPPNHPRGISRDPEAANRNKTNPIQGETP